MVRNVLWFFVGMALMGLALGLWFVLFGSLPFWRWSMNALDVWILLGIMAGGFLVAGMAQLRGRR